MDVEVRAITRDDEAGLHAWWDLGRRVDAERAVDLWPTWQSARVAYTREHPDIQMTFLGAYDGDRLVGGARVDLPLLENPHLALFFLFVDAEVRREGVGTTLLARVEDVAREGGRSSLIVVAHEPPGEPAAGSGFAAARGYAVANVEETKLVDLRPTADRWPTLAAEAAERTDGYTLLAWEDPAPDEWVDQLCLLYTRFLDEIPSGDMDLDAQQWTPERYRRAEVRRRETGRRHVIVVVAAPDGTLAGYTDLVVEEGRPDRAEIDGTLVLPEHRGHRLGLALKVRLHEELVARFPACERLFTQNATSNTWMNAVNERLGYVVAERTLELQRRL